MNRNEQINMFLNTKLNQNKMKRKGKQFLIVIQINFDMSKKTKIKLTKNILCSILNFLLFIQLKLNN